MIELQLKPTIYSYDTCREFVEDLQVGADDLIVTNQYIFDPNYLLASLCHFSFFCNCWTIFPFRRRLQRRSTNPNLRSRCADFVCFGDYVHVRQAR